MSKYNQLKQKKAPKIGHLIYFDQLVTVFRGCPSHQIFQLLTKQQQDRPFTTASINPLKTELFLCRFSRYYHDRLLSPTDSYKHGVHRKYFRYFHVTSKSKFPPNSICVSRWYLKGCWHRQHFPYIVRITKATEGMYHRQQKELETVYVLLSRCKFRAITLIVSITNINFKYSYFLNQIYSSTFLREGMRK